MTQLPHLSTADDPSDPTARDRALEEHVKRLRFAVESWEAKRDAYGADACEYRAAGRTRQAETFEDRMVDAQRALDENKARLREAEEAAGRGWLPPAPRSVQTLELAAAHARLGRRRDDEARLRVEIAWTRRRVEASAHAVTRPVGTARGRRPAGRPRARKAATPARAGPDDGPDDPAG